MLDQLKGGLVVSCQPVDGGPMDTPEIIAAMAQAAEIGGADGVRIEGVENVAAVRSKVRLPLIGIVKRDLENTPVRITPLVEDARALMAAGADIVAVDASDRWRPDAFEDVVAAVKQEGRLVMADCATFSDVQRVLARGADIIGTTLSGYTEETFSRSKAPDLELVRACKTLDCFVMAEGRYNTPDLAAQALAAGADCVTVGSALTRLEHMVSWFAAPLKAAGER